MNSLTNLTALAGLLAEAEAPAPDTGAGGLGLNTSGLLDLVKFFVVLGLTALAAAVAFAGHKMKVSKAGGFLVVAVIVMLIAGMAGLVGTDTGSRLLQRLVTI